MKEWINDYGFEYSIIDGKIYQKAQLIISFDDDYKTIRYFDDEYYSNILHIKNQILNTDNTWFNITKSYSGFPDIIFP